MTEYKVNKEYTDMSVLDEDIRKGGKEFLLYFIDNYKITDEMIPIIRKYPAFLASIRNENRERNITINLRAYPITEELKQKLFTPQSSPENDPIVISICGTTKFISVSVTISENTIESIKEITFTYDSYEEFIENWKVHSFIDYNTNGWTGKSTLLEKFLPHIRNNKISQILSE